MNKLLLSISLLIGYTSCEAQDTNYVRKHMISNTAVNFHATCYIPCRNEISFINVHDNENSSIEAAEEFLTENGGTLFQLKHSGERMISFSINGKTYSIDPNRIYSPVGIRNTLGKQYTKAAAEEVEKLAGEILRLGVEGKKLVVSLHNNTDKNFSIKSYQKGGDEAINAAAVYVNPTMDEDDFILTTERKIYDAVKAKGINVILQNNNRVKDDGSMSVYAAKHKIPYINVEAEHGHKQEQVKLLEALEDILKDYYNKK